jgi:hypothetical protein
VTPDGTNTLCLKTCKENIYIRDPEIDGRTVPKHERLEVFTAISMKNYAFWDIKTQYVPHRKHITSPLQSPTSKYYVRFEVFTAVTMKYVVFWDMKSQFILHRRQITSPLHISAGYNSKI